MNKIVKDGWPELTYRYVEHYFWEPQHLLRTAGSIAKAKLRGETRVEAVYRGLRTQEVPLNYLLNVLLRILPSAARRGCLSAFGVNTDEAHLGSLLLTTPRDKSFIQPDVHLESERARVFIEVKVDSRLTLEQVKKYVRLHAEMDRAGGVPKTALVLFLVKKPVLALSDLKVTFEHDRVAEGFASLPGLEVAGIRFGSATWGGFAAALERERATRAEEGEAGEMLRVLVGDFLSDLEQRGLTS